MKELYVYLVIMIITSIGLKFTSDNEPVSKLSYLSTYNSFLLFQGNFSEHPSFPLYQRIYLMTDEASINSSEHQVIRRYNHSNYTTSSIEVYEAIELSSQAMKKDFYSVENLIRLMDKIIIVPIEREKCLGKWEIRLEGAGMCEIKISEDIINKIGVVKQQQLQNVQIVEQFRELDDQLLKEDKVDYIAVVNQVNRKIESHLIHQEVEQIKAEDNNGMMQNFTMKEKKEVNIEQALNEHQNNQNDIVTQKIEQQRIENKYPKLLINEQRKEKQAISQAQKIPQPQTVQQQITQTQTNPQPQTVEQPITQKQQIPKQYTVQQSQTVQQPIKQTQKIPQSQALQQSQTVQQPITQTQTTPQPQTVQQSQTVQQPITQTQKIPQSQTVQQQITQSQTIPQPQTVQQPIAQTVQQPITQSQTIPQPQTVQQPITQTQKIPKQYTVQQSQKVQQPITQTQKIPQSQTVQQPITQTQTIPQPQTVQQPITQTQTTPQTQTVQQPITQTQTIPQPQTVQQSITQTQKIPQPQTVTQLQSQIQQIRLPNQEQQPQTIQQPHKQIQNINKSQLDLLQPLYQQHPQIQPIVQNQIANIQITDQITQSVSIISNQFLSNQSSLNQRINIQYSDVIQKELNSQKAQKFKLFDIQNGKRRQLSFSNEEFQAPLDLQKASDIIIPYEPFQLSSGSQTQNILNSHFGSPLNTEL